MVVYCLRQLVIFLLVLTFYYSTYYTYFDIFIVLLYCANIELK